MTGNDRDDVQTGVFTQGVDEQLGDLLRPQILVLEVDQAARPHDGLAVAARDAAFALWREVVDAVGVGIGAQQLHVVRSAYRRVRRLLGQPARTEVGAAQPVPQPRSGRVGVQRRRIVPPFPEGGVQPADDRALQGQLHVVPRRVQSVADAHGYRLWITVVGRVVAAAVAQVDAADERHVALRRPRMPDHDQLLVMRAARRTRWSSSTSPPARSIASPRCLFSCSLNRNLSRCERHIRPFTTTPRSAAPLNRSRMVGPPGRISSSGSPRQSVNNR